MEASPTFRNPAISAVDFTSLAKAFAVVLSKIAFAIKNRNLVTDSNIPYSYNLHPNPPGRGKFGICLGIMI